MSFAQLREIPKTSGFKVAALFLLLFAGSTFSLLGFVYWKTVHYMTEQVSDQLHLTARNISLIPPNKLPKQITNYQEKDPAFLTPIGLFKLDGQYIAGQLRYPPKHQRYGKVYDFTARRIDNNKKLKLRGIIHLVPDTDMMVVIAIDIYEMHEFHELLIGAIASGIGLTLIIGIISAMILGLSSRQQLNSITRAIEKINQGNLKERLPIKHLSSDVGKISNTVNHMLDEIERLMQQLKQTSDNIAHDLRTPLTRLLAGLERALRKPHTVPEYIQTIEQAQHETQGLLHTFNALLRIADVESNVRRNYFKTVDLDKIINDAIELFEPLAEEKQINLITKKDNQPLLIQGDPYLLFDALSNLINNAIKFTPTTGVVSVSLKQTSDAIILTVQDSGIGIPEEEREAVFRRFYRAEHSRSTPGNGLGLSMVAAVAKLHHMTLTLHDAKPGCLFSLVLNLHT